MITFVCWKWCQPNHRTTYTAEHANIWHAQVARNYREPHRAVCVTDDPAGVDFETFPLWSDCRDARNPSGAHLPSCYRRLKVFDSLTLAEMDVGEGETVVSMDLDVVIVADLAPMLHMHADAPFVGWRGVGSYNPVVYNGTIFRFTAGAMDYLWTEFDPATSPINTNRAKYFGSDQGWLSYRLNGSAPGWGAADGMLSYTTNMSGVRSRTGGRAVLPAGARIVSFNGKRKPWEAQVQAASPWIRNFWRT